MKLIRHNEIYFMTRLTLYKSSHYQIVMARIYSKSLFTFSYTKAVDTIGNYSK